MGSVEFAKSKGEEERNDVGAEVSLVKDGLNVDYNLVEC